MASNWDTNTYDWTKSAGSVFGGSSPNYSSNPWSGSAWSYGSTPTFTPDWGGTIPNVTGTFRTPGILPGIDWSRSEAIPSYSPSRSSDFDVTKAFEAVGKSLERLGGSRGIAGQNTSIDRTIKGSVANAELVGKGRGYRLYQSGPDMYEKKEVEQNQPSRGSGIASTLLGIAAPIASVIPGGQAVGAGLAAASGGFRAFGL